MKVQPKVTIVVAIGASLCALSAGAILVSSLAFAQSDDTRLSTKVRKFITAAEHAANHGRYNDSIINYRSAKDSIITKCDLEAAIAGEKAALMAKMMQLRSKSGDVTTEPAVTYRQTIERERKNMRERCAL